MMMRSLLMIPVQGSRLAGSRTVRRKHAFARPEKYATGALVVAWKIGQSVVSISFCVLHSELVFFYFIFFSLLFSRKNCPRKNLILSFSTLSFSDIFSFKPSSYDHAMESWSICWQFPFSRTIKVLIFYFSAALSIMAHAPLDRLFVLFVLFVPMHKLSSPPPDPLCGLSSYFP